jgi:hypothetical protein
MIKPNDFEASECRFVCEDSLLISGSPTPPRLLDYAIIIYRPI